MLRERRNVLTIGSRPITPARRASRWAVPAGLCAALGGLLALALAVTASPATAAAGLGLGTADQYSVLGATTVTNTGSSVLSDDLGLSPGTSATGFSTATIGGATHIADAQALQAQSDLTTAYNAAAGASATGGSLGASLVGGVHGPGVYNASSALGMSGAVTLDGRGNPNSLFIFQIGAGFTTASSTSVVLIGAAQACNVFWQVGSSATLGTNNAFVGTIMALTSISLNTGTTVQGRALARNGAVTLDNNVFTTPGCDLTTPTTSTSATATPTTTSTSPGSTATSTPTRTGAGPSTTARTTAPGGSLSTSRTAAVIGTNTTGSTLVPVGGTPVQLASTGSAVTPLLRLGGVLLVLGFVLTGAGYRRARRSPLHAR